VHVEDLALDTAFLLLISRVVLMM